MILRDDRVYSAREIWRVSGMPRAAVYAALSAGDLRSIRRGRRWLVPGAQAKAWIAQLGRGDSP
jgi:hypothetical protein